MLVTNIVPRLLHLDKFYDLTWTRTTILHIQRVNHCTIEVRVLSYNIESNTWTDTWQYISCVSGQQTKPQCSHKIEVNAQVGRIQSPGYPYPYRSGCEWTYTINVGEYGSEIEIIMQTFDIDQAAGDNLYVATGKSSRSGCWRQPVCSYW
jgi:CUB domain.